jgi:hypothetical protein
LFLSRSKMSNDKCLNVLSNDNSLNDNDDIMII